MGPARIRGWGVEDGEVSIFATPKDAAKAASRRAAHSSKRDSGRVTVIGGSESYSGAPSLASTSAYSVLAALRVGAGYAVAFVPRPILNVNRATSPSVIVRPMKGAHLSNSDSRILRAEMSKSNSVVIGPGIGRKAATLAAAAGLITHASRNGIRMVVDADALAAVAKHRPRLGPALVLTPNDSEFALLSGKRVDRRDLAKRIAAAVALSRKLHTNILLKGHETVITDGERVKVVRSKTAALATMGTGDVLSGIIAGYAARGGDIFSAAVAGAYLHSAIGDALYKNRGNHIIASDVVDYIPRAMKRIEAVM